MKVIFSYLLLTSAKGTRPTPPILKCAPTKRSERLNNIKNHGTVSDSFLQFRTSLTTLHFVIVSNIFSKSPKTTITGGINAHPDRE